MPDLVETIHPNDEMLRPGKEEWYFRLGEWAAACVKQGVACAGLSFDVRTDSILDLPCGYGRVLRFLKEEYPNAAITACDIIEEAVDFCVETFGVQGLYSSQDPREIKTASYNLIWSGSLLTHLPEESWEPWLSFFADHLTPSGCAVFTTHGEAYARGAFPQHMPDDFPHLQDAYRTGGFAFWRHPRRLKSDPGISLSSPEWVLGKIRQRPDLRVTAFMERGWHDAHDVWCVTKVPTFRTEADEHRATSIGASSPDATAS
jgi:SAM-dependent methyltransferase